MSNRLLLTLACALTTATLSAQGGEHMQPFQYEVGGGFTTTSFDTTPDIDINEYMLFGTYHLHPVAMETGPWNEAAFLEHSSEVSVRAQYVTLDAGAFSADGFVGGAGFRYADKDQPIAAEIGFTYGSLNGDSGVDVDLSTIAARVGYWLRPNAIVGVDFAREKTDGNGVLEIEDRRFGVFGKIVHDLGDGRAINGEAHIGIDSVDDSVSTEENVELEASGDYYFTPRHSVGARLGTAFGDATADEGTTFGVRGSAWVTPQVAVTAEYEAFHASNGTGSDTDSFSILLAVRF